MTKLGCLTITTLIALSSMAMAQSVTPTVSNGGSFMLAQAQGMSQEPAAAPYKEEDVKNWQEDNAQVPKD